MRCLHVCLSVNNFTLTLLNGFAWKFHHSRVCRQGRTHYKICIFPQSGSYYWKNRAYLRENFISNVYLDKKVSIKFWKSSGCRFRFFLADVWALRMFLLFIFFTSEAKLIHVVPFAVPSLTPKRHTIYVVPGPSDGGRVWRTGAWWVTFSRVLSGPGRTRRVDAVTLTCAALMAHIGHLPGQFTSPVNSTPESASPTVWLSYVTAKSPGADVQHQP